MSTDSVEKAYRVARWIPEPATPEGSTRYGQVLEDMRRLVAHDWCGEAIAGRRTMRVIDVCGAWGVAGIAFAKVLEERGVETELTILDVRGDPEAAAKALGQRELGKTPTYVKSDATRLTDLGIKFDVAILWGMSTPHFDPWEMTKLLAGLSLNLVENGLFLLEESDRVFTVFMRSGYQRVLPENAGKEKAVISLHSDYNPVRGTANRVMVDLLEGEAAADDFYFWGLADSAQSLWMFFGDVDFLPRDRYSGVLVAKKPRRRIDASEFLESEPRMLK